MINIMVVDDAAFMRLMLKEILNEFKYEVVAEAKNGEEAVQYYKQIRPHLVFMDITMPDMDGIDALIEIKKFDSAARVIMCSALGQQNNVLQSIHAGAKDFIVKPFYKERIIEAINKAMNIT